MPARQVMFGRRHAAGDERIGETCAVHMRAEPRRVGDVTEFRDLVDPVDRPGLGRLRQRQRAGLGRFDKPARKARQCLAKGCGRDLAAVSGDPDQLRAAGEEFRGAALVVVDMRLLVAEHGLPGLGQRRKRERVRGGAGGDEKCGDLRFEHIAQHRRRPRGVVVRAIGRRIHPGRRRDRLQNLRRDPGAVVAREVHSALGSLERANCPKLGQVGNS